jgi:AcrR family transcriptional regulator
MARPKTKSDDAVLEAAHRVLLRRGPHAATLAEIAREARLSPATLVQRFGSKKNLLAAFAKRSAERAGAELGVPADGSQRAQAPLRALREALCRQAGDLGDRTGLANSMAMLLEDVRDEELRGHARTHAERVEAAIAAYLEAAAKRGEIVWRDVPALARLVQATYNGAIIQWALRGKGPLDKWVGDTLDIAFALASRKG